MAKFLLTGGTIGRPVGLTAAEDRSQLYESAVIVMLDTTTGACSQVLSYQTPGSHGPPGRRNSVFKAASITSHRELVVCTETEVLEVAIDGLGRGDFGLKVLNVHSDRSFNDLHHVTTEVDAGRAWIVNTGLDAIAVLDFMSGDVENHSVTGEEVWNRFDKEVDYRSIYSTKPHQSHPNYVFEFEGERWVTRFHDQDAMSLTSGRTLDIAVGNPHDGFVNDAGVTFTTTNGHLVRFRTSSSPPEVMALGDADSPLGWCRSLHVSGDGRHLVGFSSLRKTRWRSNLSRMHKSVLGSPSSPESRVAMYSGFGGELLAEWPTSRAGLDAIFSILPLETDSA